MTKPGARQMSFDGREVTHHLLEMGDVKFDYVPEGMTADDLAGLSLHDEVEATVRFKVRHVGHDEDVDRLGSGTKPLTRTIVLKTQHIGFEVKRILKRGDIEETWKETHGATG